MEIDEKNQNYEMYPSDIINEEEYEESEASALKRPGEISKILSGRGVSGF